MVDRAGVFKVTKCKIGMQVTPTGTPVLNNEVKSPELRVSKATSYINARLNRWMTEFRAHTQKDRTFKNIPKPYTLESARDLFFFFYI